MATLYFNAAVDGDWNTLGNWWTDDTFTTQASALPTEADSVIATASLGSNSGSEPTVVNLTQDSGNIVITVTVTGMATFNNSTYNYGNVKGNATFNGSSTNSGYVNVDYSHTATFNDYSRNLFIVEGQGVFNDYSYNNFNVNDFATFNDYSYNDIFGQLTSLSTFNNYSYNAGDIGEFAVAAFNDSSYNTGTVSTTSFTIEEGVPLATYSGLVSGTKTFTRVSPWPPLRGINGSSILGVI